MRSSEAPSNRARLLRRATLVAALLLAALALVTWWRPTPAVPVARPVPGPARPSAQVRAPRPSPPEPATVSREEAARYAAAREAIDAVGAVTGRTVVSCPYPDLEGGGYGRQNDVVSLWGGPGVVLLATPEPAGSLMFQGDGFDRATGRVTERPPQGVLGWSTLPDGTVACSWTEASHVPMRVRVVDEDGMELVEGPTLEQVLSVRPLTLDEADALARAMLDGLQFAHERGFVHRDLKPGNVLLARFGDRLVPKISDFGLAKALDVDLPGATRTGTSLGTPPYMAPEQIRDAASADARADVFSTGAILHELLTGRRAFEGADVWEVFKAIQEGRAAPLPAGTPERMRVAVERALEVDRDRRVASASALREASA
jgi:hypothetical protein